MKKTNELDVRGTLVRVIKIGGEDYVCLTDMAKLRSEDPSFTINHWMRTRMTIEYLGLWETLYNPNFKPTEFGRFREECGLNTFVLSPTKWITSTNAIGIVAQSGRYSTATTLEEAQRNRHPADAHFVGSRRQKVSQVIIKRENQ